MIVQSQLQRDGAKYLKISTTKGIDQTSSGSKGTGQPNRSMGMEGESAESGGGSSPLPVKLNPIVFTYARNAGVAAIFSSSVHCQLPACILFSAPTTAWGWRGFFQMGDSAMGIAGRAVLHTLLRPGADAGVSFSCLRRCICKHASFLVHGA